MGLTVKYNNVDVTTHVLSYSREGHICSGITTGTIVLTREFYDTHNPIPYGVFKVYEDSVKVGTYYVSSVEVNRNGAQVSVDFQDVTKKLVDYFIDVSYDITYASYSKYWMEKFLTEAGVSYVFDTAVDDNGSIMSSNTSIGLDTALNILTTLVQQSCWYFHADADGILRIGKLDVDIETQDINLGDADVINVSTNKKDDILRNRVVVWGSANEDNQGWVFADSSVYTPYNYDQSDLRTAVLSNGNIMYNGDAKALADRILKETQHINYIKTVTIAGFVNVTLGQTAFINTREYVGWALITSIIVDLSSSRQGYVTELTLDERCPRIYAYFGIRTPHVYAGTAGAGVWAKPLDADGWSNFSSGLTCLDITDLAVNRSVLSCVASDGSLFYRQMVTPWYKYSPGNLPVTMSGILASGESYPIPSGMTEESVAASGLVYSSADVACMACDINKSTNEIYGIYTLSGMLTPYSGMYVSASGINMGISVPNNGEVPSSGWIPYSGSYWHSWLATLAANGNAVVNEVVVNGTNDVFAYDVACNDTDVYLSVLLKGTINPMRYSSAMLLPTLGRTSASNNVFDNTSQNTLCFETDDIGHMDSTIQTATVGTNTLAYATFNNHGVIYVDSIYRDSMSGELRLVHTVGDSDAGSTTFLVEATAVGTTYLAAYMTKSSVDMCEVLLIEANLTLMTRDVYHYRLHMVDDEVQVIKVIADSHPLTDSSTYKFYDMDVKDDSFYYLYATKGYVGGGTYNVANYCAKVSMTNGMSTTIKLHEYSAVVNLFPRLFAILHDSFWFNYILSYQTAIGSIYMYVNRTEICHVDNDYLQTIPGVVPGTYINYGTLSNSAGVFSGSAISKQQSYYIYQSDMSFNLIGIPPGDTSKYRSVELYTNFTVSTENQAIWNTKISYVVTDYDGNVVADNYTGDPYYTERWGIGIRSYNDPCMIDEIESGGLLVINKRSFLDNSLLNSVTAKYKDDTDLVIASTPKLVIESDYFDDIVYFVYGTSIYGIDVNTGYIERYTEISSHANTSVHLKQNALAFYDGSSSVYSAVDIMIPIRFHYIPKRDVIYNGVAKRTTEGDYLLIGITPQITHLELSNSLPLVAFGGNSSTGYGFCKIFPLHDMDETLLSNYTVSGMVNEPSFIIPLSYTVSGEVIRSSYVRDARTFYYNDLLASSQYLAMACDTVSGLLNSIDLNNVDTQSLFYTTQSGQGYNFATIPIPSGVPTHFETSNSDDVPYMFVSVSGVPSMFYERKGREYNTLATAFNNYSFGLPAANITCIRIDDKY